MKLKTSQKFLLAGLSGALLALSFPPLPFYIFAFIAFVPILFIFMESEGTKPKFSLLYLTFFIYHAGTNWWISSWQKETDPYLMASGLALTVLHPFFFMIPFAIFFIISRKFSKNFALWLFPFLWVAFEYAHGLGELSYPWLTIGNTQFYNHNWVQIIDIIGTYGASFLIALTNVLVLQLILFLRKNGLKGKEILKHSLSKKFVLSIFAIIIIPNIYGIFVSDNYDYEKLLKTNKSIKIGLIQPNVNPWRKWVTSVPMQIALHKRLQDSLIVKSGKIDLAIWSETAIPYFGVAVNAYHDYPMITDWVDTSSTSLLTGFTELKIFKNKKEATVTARVHPLDSNMIYESYNTAIILNPFNKDRQIYKKMRLTPLAERLPYADYLLFARGWFEWGVGISAWGIGKEQKNLNYIKNNDIIPIGTIICIESIYPDFVRNFANQGAEVLTVITNDAWYDYTFGPEQHYIIAAMRAIENRRFLARVANTGVTGFISPNGKTIKRAEQYKSTAISATIPLIKEKSLYTMYGDLIAKFSLLLTIMIIFFIFISSFFKKNNFNAQ